MICNFEELSFQIVTVDRFLHRKGFFSVKARPYAALSFRVSGTGDFKIGGKRFVIHPGEILFIPANVPYEVEYSVSESIVANLSDCNYVEAEKITLENVAAIELGFGRLVEAWGKEHSVNRTKSVLYDLLEKIENDKRTSMADTAVEACVRYMEEHLSDCELDVEAVCRYGFISASSLQRAFGEYFGISPKQYLIKLRMERALQLLAEGGLSVREVALACGFSDEKYFSRAFRKKYGYPPSKTRNHIVV